MILYLVDLHRETRFYALIFFLLAVPGTDELTSAFLFFKLKNKANTSFVVLFWGLNNFMSVESTLNSNSK